MDWRCIYDIVYYITRDIWNACATCNVFRLVYVCHHSYRGTLSLSASLKLFRRLLGCCVAWLHYDTLTAVIIIFMPLQIVYNLRISFVKSTINNNNTLSHTHTPALVWARESTCVCLSLGVPFDYTILTLCRSSFHSIWTNDEPPLLYYHRRISPHWQTHTNWIYAWYDNIFDANVCVCW